MKKQDAVKSVQLAIKSPLLNSESKLSNDSSVDDQWIYMLRMRQMAMDRSPQHPAGLPRSQSSSLNNLSQILPYLQNQESYAAAVRRVLVKSTLQVTPITYSRSSSPTQFGLTLSSLSLHSSKGSSASSTASDSPSERERTRNRAKRNYFHQNSHSSSAQRSGGKSSQASSGKYYKSYTVSQNQPRTYDYKTSQKWPKSESTHTGDASANHRRG
ncbi:unnamed protein product [Staurois parvus]|uniref:Vitellogenin n=1 Tax=Staurois parvus TaxID=386267 RepID=A0ABN9AF83_9NEOB|nr:unnamed protein product [Staurois parvus]